MVGCMQREQTTREALIEGRDNTAPEYRPHYIIGVAKGCANIIGAQVLLARNELDRMSKETGTTASGVGYILEKLDKIDEMIGDMEAVAS